jgi:hypothetical protein
LLWKISLERSRKSRWDKLNWAYELLAYGDDVNLLEDSIDNIKRNTEI